MLKLIQKWHVIELGTEYIKTMIITKSHTFRMLEKRLYRLSKGMGNTKNNQIKLLKVKITIFEMEKISWMGLMRVLHCRKEDL